MRITVTGVTSTEVGAPHVRFDSNIGCGAGGWRSERWSAEIGRVFFIELDIQPVAILGGNMSESASESPSIRCEAETLVLNGFFESIDPDGVGYFRLAPDCIAMVETAEPTPKPDQWLTIRVPSTDVGLYPHDADFM